ncbi:hypothetical protein [Luteimonas sp. MHLX1A]|uniref:hypothetical protein n=1 Tax=Alterluteimonas muca TaxID=2878684 RepID=UPI001E2CFF97|nr:hypothetical protein [Luteimonas sp. MHLX1A]MCD9047860.1 hypothetical protein [Luteimonas sp. MHLX1A]
MNKHASEEVQIELHTTEPPDGSGITSRSPIDELVAGMIRTMEEIQRDPLLHHRLSQRGF